MHFKKVAPITLVLLAIAILAGCAKKPRRPNPIETVMGGGSGQGSDVVDPATLGGEGFVDPMDSIPSRDLDDPYANAERGILPTVYFDFDSASIRPSERGKLTQVASFLSSNPGADLLLEGHCDWRGPSEYNLVLGDKRSKSLQSYLQTLGAGADRLKTVSKGDLNATEGAGSEQMGLERKVEILVLR